MTMKHVGYWSCEKIRRSQNSPWPFNLGSTLMAKLHAPTSLPSWSILHIKWCREVGKAGKTSLMSPSHGFTWSFPKIGLPPNHPFWQNFPFRTIRFGVPPWIWTTPTCEQFPLPVALVPSHRQTHIPGSWEWSRDHLQLLQALYPLVI
jgi:hypothetical protein